MKNISGEHCRENKNTHFIFCNVFKNRSVYVTMLKKYCLAGQATDGNTAHAHCLLDA
jgi:hypothetical protein